MSSNNKYNVPAPQKSQVLHNLGLAIAVVGGLLCLLALFSETGRQRLGFGYVWGFSFVWTIMLGSLFFVAIYHLTHATWSVVVRRVGEMLAAPLGIFAVLFTPIALTVIFNAAFDVYPWADSELMEQDHLLHGKMAFLNVPFFLIRAAVYFGIWIFFARFFIGKSIQQDAGGDTESVTLQMRGRAPVFVMLFALTASFAAIDWLMSLNPYWFSTIFGVYIFAGMSVSSLSAVIIAVYFLKRSDRLGEKMITDHHIYNLGVLLFAFVCFWAYIAFSQYMLIWYANVPEENFYMVKRLEGGWKSVSLVLALVRFIIPFLMLLPRSSKTCITRLSVIAGFMLFGQLLDLYWLIMPELHEVGPVLGWQELGPVLALSGVFLLCLSRFMSRNRVVAVGDPLLEQSADFRL
jgi:hypothetical protein